MTKAIRTVAIVGAGLVGSGWAIVFARAGLEVKLYDVDAGIRNHVPAFLKGALEDMQGAGLVDKVDEVLARIEVVDTLEAAVTPAQYVQELSIRAC